MLQRRTNDLFTIFDAFFDDRRLSRLEPQKIYYDDVRSYSDGKTSKIFKNGVLHSVNGEPAIIEFNEKGEVTKEHYFWEGERTTKDVVKSKIQEIEDNREHVIDLGGKTYKVKGKKLKEIEKLLGLEEVK
jgi:hypothetical protein